MRKLIGIILLGMLPWMAHAQRFVRTVDTIAELAALNPRDVHRSVYVRGYWEPNDGGGGLFYPTNTVLSTNIGTRIKAIQLGWSYDRDWSGSVNVKHWGAKGDGITDDYLPIQAALNFCKDKYELFFPKGDYITHTSLDATGDPSFYRNRFRIRGDGMYSTAIYGDELGYPVLDMLGAANCVVQDITIVALANRPNSCILIGRPKDPAMPTTTFSAGEHKFVNVRTFGDFTIAGVIAHSSEVNTYECCYFTAGGPANPAHAFLSSPACNVSYGAASKYELLADNGAFGTALGGNTVHNFTQCRFTNWPRDAGASAGACAVFEWTSGLQMVDCYFSSTACTNQIVIRGGASNWRLDGVIQEAYIYTNQVDGMVFPQPSGLFVDNTNALGTASFLYESAFIGCTMFPLRVQTNSWMVNTSWKNHIWENHNFNPASGIPPFDTNIWTVSYAGAETNNHSVVHVRGYCRDNDFGSYNPDIVGLYMERWPTFYFENENLRNKFPNNVAVAGISDWASYTNTTRAVAMSQWKAIDPRPSLYWPVNGDITSSRVQLTLNVTNIIGTNDFTFHTFCRIPRVGEQYDRFVGLIAIEHASLQTTNAFYAAMLDQSTDPGGAIFVYAYKYGGTVADYRQIVTENNVYSKYGGMPAKITISRHAGEMFVWVNDDLQTNEIDAVVGGGDANWNIILGGNTVLVGDRVPNTGETFRGHMYNFGLLNYAITSIPQVISDAGLGGRTSWGSNIGTWGSTPGAFLDLDFGIGYGIIVPDRSPFNQHATITATHVKWNVPASKKLYVDDVDMVAREFITPRAGLYWPSGAAAGSSVSGTLNSPIGTEDFAVYMHLQIPTNGAPYKGLWNISTAPATGGADGNVNCVIGGTQLFVLGYPPAATALDYILAYTDTSFTTTWGGKWVKLYVGRSGTNIVGWINDTPIAFSYLANSVAAPADFGINIVNQEFVVGIRELPEPYLGTMYACGIYNGWPATKTDIQEMQSYGVTRPWRWGTWDWVTPGFLLLWDLTTGSREGLVPDDSPFEQWGFMSGSVTNAVDAPRLVQIGDVSLRATNTTLILTGDLQVTGTATLGSSPVPLPDTQVAFGAGDNFLTNSPLFTLYTTNLITSNLILRVPSIRLDADQADIMDLMFGTAYNNGIEYDATATNFTFWYGIGGSAFRLADIGYHYVKSQKPLILEDSAKIKVASDYAGIGGVLVMDTTDTANVGTGEDNLIVYTMPLNSMSANGQSIDVDMWGLFADNGNAKTLKLYFGSANVYSSGAVVFTGGIKWHAKMTVIRVGAAVQKVFTEVATSSSLLVSTNSYATPTEDLTAAVVIKATGEATSDGDVYQNALRIKWLPNAP